jgi:C4-dicarboxylate-specific signal transduction histidine kinase
LRDLEMAFLGKITASMTHEIKNTLAIIQESSGLLSDLITLSQEGSFPHKDKFLRVLGNINDQVNRGVDITTRLNQFAHSMDEPLISVNVADLLGRVVLLMRRLAKRQGIELTAEAADRDLSLMSDPFRLQLVLASVIEELAGSLGSGAAIALQTASAPREVTIFLEVRGAAKPGWQGLANTLFPGLKEVLEILRAGLAVSSAPGREGVVMTIPLPEPGKA